MGKSSLFACFYRFIKVLNEIAPEIIKWPTRAEAQRVMPDFRRLALLPNVIGAIDGTFVKIKAPKQHPEVYINRKCFYGITLQAICTADLKFTDCFAGYPSSVSDLRVFRNSDIYQEFTSNTNDYFTEGSFIIGDKAYPLFNWCIPPYIDRGNLPEIQRNFNRIHAKTRQVIERAFALLFGRFRRLRDLDMNRVDLIPATIIACFVLHNLCLINPDELLNEYVNDGMRILVENNDNNVEIPLMDHNLGELRRNELAQELYNYE